MDEQEFPSAPAEEAVEKRKGLLGRVQQGVGAVKQAQAGRAERKTEAAQAQADALRAQRQALLEAGHDLYEYRVVPIRQTLIGDKIDVSQVERTLNEWAAQGWRVKSVTETSVGGRVGPGGVSGLIIVFERRLAPS